MTEDRARQGPKDKENECEHPNFQSQIDHLIYISSDLDFIFLSSEQPASQRMTVAS